MITLDLLKRHDLISLLGSIASLNIADRITFEIGLIVPSEFLPVFCVCRKKEVKQMKKNQLDLVIV